MVQAATVGDLEIQTGIGLSMTRGQRLMGASALVMLALFFLTLGVWQLGLNISTAANSYGVPGSRAPDVAPALRAGPSLICIVVGIGFLTAGALTAFGQRRRRTRDRYRT